jgi:DNA-binding NarL/FixJ family response regulator
MSSSTISVFLIDDHTIFAQSFGAYMATFSQFSWKGSADGSEKTIREVLRISPRVLLLDYHLKQNTGLEIAQELRVSGYSNSIVMLTMNRDSYIRQAARLQGVNGFVSKEVDGELLLDGLVQLVDGQIDYLELITHSQEQELLPFNLTPQEKKVADLICSGQSTEEVATQLSISIHTVHTHRRRILEKTGADNFMQVCQKLA